jgi:DNA-binding Lrp family transcriptional regulator
VSGREESAAVVSLDDADRAIINALQGGFPLSDEPYREVAAALGLSEEALLARLRRLLDDKVLTRFGPMFQVERMGGAFVLAALKVPEADYERIAEIVNGFAEVATTTAASTRSTCGSCSPPKRPRASPRRSPPSKPRPDCRCSRSRRSASTSSR